MSIRDRMKQWARETFYSIDSPKPLTYAKLVETREILDSGYQYPPHRADPAKRKRRKRSQASRRANRTIH